MSLGRVFTLWITGRGARLLRGAFEPLLELADPAAPAGGEDPGLALRRLLPPRAPVQVILGLPELAVRCQDTPFLDPREQAQAARRLLREADPAGGGRAAHVLDVDPLAEGGHVLWLASCPEPALDPWLDLLRQAGARPVWVLPWTRALQAAGPDDAPEALCLALEPGAGHLLCFRGRALRFQRAFPLPPGLDLEAPAAAGLETLRTAVGAALTLFLQFLRQKHRDAVPATLLSAGVPAEAQPMLDRLAWEHDLVWRDLGPSLAQVLLDGAARERSRAHPLDLLPLEIRQARQRTALRATVLAALAGLLVLGGGTKAFLALHEAALAREAVQAEAVLARRQALAKAGDAVARLRFGLLRARWAEARQKLAAEHLEQVGVRVFQVPAGLELQRVEIRQEPGDDLTDRFLVEGTAASAGAFSLGRFAAYYQHLAALPGIQLEPLRQVEVTDRPPGAAPGPQPGSPITRFHVEGLGR
jgi:hypothetical protein